MQKSRSRFQEHLSQLTNVDEMYEQIRVVDPIQKKVLFVKGGAQSALTPAEHTCFDLWGKGEACKNCISMRVYNEQETFIKLDTSEDKIMMVTAIPIQMEEGTLVVELIKNVTNSMILDDVSLLDGVKIKKLLEEANVAAVTDELTQLHNRRYLSERLPVEVAKAQSEESPLSLLMVDIDHFKKVNDTYGHLAGDYVLKEFASILNEHVSNEVGWMARFGGEEFVVCLGATPKEEARALANRIREAVETRIFSFEGHPISITSSFGLSALEKERVVDHIALVSEADQKLYLAKRSGRNCIVG